jgi:hypothetical protein
MYMVLGFGLGLTITPRLRFHPSSLMFFLLSQGMFVSICQATRQRAAQQAVQRLYMAAVLPTADDTVAAGWSPDGDAAQFARCVQLYQAPAALGGLRTSRFGSFALTQDQLECGWF